MEFVRFTSSQRYGTRVPLRQLAFKVTVSRAFLIEDEAPEVLCEVTIPWNMKLPSPAERLSVYKQLEAALAAPGPSFADQAKTAAAATHLGVESDAPASVTATRDSGALPTRAQVVAQLRSASSQLFTRPPMEDFIDASEEDFPVDPPMGGSMLAPIVLRQHRRDHQPNNRMYFMWATGKVTGAPEASLTLQREPKQTRGDGEAESGETPSYSMSGLDWVGEERVLCTITAERNDNFFTAKPSLNAPHTILVDAVYIYSFTIRAVDLASLGAEQRHSHSAEAHRSPTNSAAAKDASSRHNGHGSPCDSLDPLAAATANAFLPPSPAAFETLAAAEQATESIRSMSVQAAARYEALQLSEDSTDESGRAARLPSAARQAAAQRLLRDAAMAAPDDRSEASPRAAGDVASSSTARAVSVEERVPLVGAEGGGPDSALRGPAPQGRRASVTVSPQTSEGARCRFFVYGVVERCLGLPYDTLYLRCMLVQDPQPGCADGTAREVPTFFLEQDALAKARGNASSRSPHQQESVFSTQLAYAGAVTVEDYLVETDHVFNTPFEYVYVDDELPKAPLRLVVTAFSEGFAAKDTQTPVGYCSVSLPVVVPGTHRVECPMWKPHQTGREFVKAMVAGGGPGLVDPRESGPALRGRTGISVKQGLLADSGGLLCLTINVVQQGGVLL